MEYFFEFLNAYDFAGEGDEEIAEENKTLINASVLGLIFEKINGYKDGSYFTPGFITMYVPGQYQADTVLSHHLSMHSCNHAMNSYRVEFLKFKNLSLHRSERYMS